MLRYSYLLWVLVLVASLCCTGPCADAQITSQTEVSALRAIRRSLTDPYKRLNWTKGDPCTSNWTGVVCFNKTLDDGYLHVRELQLWSMNFSGSLSPELGQLLRMNILSFMWNQLGGSIPKEIGNIKSLELLLLNGNQLSGTLPDELGYLPNLDRIQIDENQISGPLPKSFANLNKTKHFHMNNNSISGQIPPELSRLPSLVHFLLDNNNLSGHLPEEFFMLPNLLILQLDNNNFSGTSIPTSYGNMTKLLKLSLRNCSLQGQIPDLSRIPELGYIDLSWNQLTGTIPENKLSNNITTIDLSNNNLTGLIPANFSDLPLLQKLSLNNNSLNGSVSSLSWEKVIFNATARLILDFENNFISNISGVLRPPASVTLMLQGNPVCANANQLNITQFCGPHTGDEKQGNSTPECHCATDLFLEHIPAFYPSCFCAAPLRVGYRLKSPGISDFPPYLDSFHAYLSSGLGLILYQLSIDSFIWEEGPRLRMYLKIFPPRNVSKFNASEIRRIRRMFSGWNIEDNNIFGPYELLNFTLLGPYSTDMVESNNSGLKKGVVVGIVLGAVAASVTLSAIVSIIILRMRSGYHHGVSQKRAASKAEMRIEGVKGFTFTEMSAATNNFDNSTQVGQGGYGKVYKGILTDGTVVAIKRAQEGSLQGSKEFYTEIELLSRLHHRNLVSLIGYCDEEDEQMLVYEFMSNGTLHDHLSGKIIEPLSFSMRLRIALGSAKGILYLHTEADPPLFHRDIKTTNILLDSKFTAKVADFGLSRLAPVLEADGTIPGYVSTVVKGTPGYLDPEYFLTHKLTDKSDVYSLGIVFLELLTGMRPISHGKNIVREVNAAYQSGTVFSVIDDRMGSYPSECVGRFMSLALRCCHDETDARPSMVEVMRELDLIMQMTLEADPAETHPRKFDATKPSSMKATGHPYLSMDVSGSNLDSCILPTIAPR